MSTPVKTYLKQVEDALRAGNATEHTFRPALKTLLEALASGVTATNEPKRIACGAPDFVIDRGGFTVGYVEAKDVGKPLGEVERGEQLKRYRRALGNLLLTDQLEFRWYVDGQWRETVTVGRWEGGKLTPQKGGPEALAALIGLFMAHRPEDITTPRELAERMARLTHIIRDVIIEAFQTDNASGLLRGWRDAFARVLIADLNLPEKTPEFADMFAQTLAYGLFTARVMDTTPKTFTRQEAQSLIPNTNPFLRDFFYQISGPQLDDEPFGVFVDDLVNTLAHTDMDRVLAEFGKRTRQEDPVVHFYETFLAAYDPKLRESRGVYYTPEPVVSYIVRSVDHLLKTRFNLPGGLADTSKVTIPNRDPGKRVQGKNVARKTDESHRVLVLDPATGTGTFLYAVIDHIRAQFMERGDAGLWPGYVRDHLLPRLFGFELLMAPYAVAHFKLSLQLAGRDLPENIRDKWAYTPETGERLGVYLTNTLEGIHEYSDLPLLAGLAAESNAASDIKMNLPVLVVMGNPPYSGHSSNKGEWIANLLRGKLPDGGKTANYYEVDGQPLGERNPKWLQDDYVKFIRFAQWRIEQSGQGILAFISNNGYLDNPTFRGMRQSLLQSFSDIYILNLHGNALKKDQSPDGSKDENVFDIRQGVTIGIFVKEPGKAGTKIIYYDDLWGSRARKYERLLDEPIEAMSFQKIEPQSPFYFFIPFATDLLAEYEEGWKITEIFPVSSVGLVTARDKLAIQWTREDMWKTVSDFSQLPTENAREQYKLGRDARDWKVYLAQADVQETGPSIEGISPVLYRPFDIRYTYYTGRSRGFICMPRPEVMDNMRDGNNLALITSRLTKGETYQHTQVSKNIVEVICMSPKTSNNGFVFPLFIKPKSTITKQNNLFSSSPWEIDERHNRTPNLSPTFIADLEAKLNLRFQPIQRAAEESEFGPEDVFHYIYAVLHSPTYRARYAEFLKIDFPRVPLTGDPALFRALAALGRELVALHLLESPALNTLITRYPIPGDNRVEAGYPKYTRVASEPAGRVHLNNTQYFDGVPQDVWEFHVGGYQVLDKWLKDRRGRQLAYDDLTHYQRVVVALQRTMALMAEIDAVVGEWPMK
ncbi:type ISP restriction/modification enzyme [Candidatus Promineifilum breve]|nr:type ISP restriction/modification enzyme [Candidatus Promineifilum breve]